MRSCVRSGTMVLGVLIASAATCSHGIAQSLAQGLAQGLPAASSAAPQAGANSFSEAQARQLVRDHGFTDVSPLVNDKQGIWHGTAKNGTGKVQVSVDFKGHVSAIPE